MLSAGVIRLFCCTDCSWLGTDAAPTAGVIRLFCCTDCCWLGTDATVGWSRSVVLLHSDCCWGPMSPSAAGLFYTCAPFSINIFCTDWQRALRTRSTRKQNKRALTRLATATTKPVCDWFLRWPICLLRLRAESLCLREEEL